MLNSLQAVSLGCAPTPIQYRARLTSSLISFHGRPCVSPGRGGFGIGSYVPRTSRGSELRAVLFDWHCQHVNLFFLSTSFSVYELEVEIVRIVIGRVYVWGWVRN